MKTKEQKIKELTNFHCPIESEQESKHLGDLLKKYSNITASSYDYDEEWRFFAIWDEAGLSNKYKAGSIMANSYVYNNTVGISYKEMEEKIQNLYETINVELAPQEAFFIEKILDIKQPLKELVHRIYHQTETSMVDYFFGTKNRYRAKELWCKFSKATIDIENIDDLFKEEEKIFTFSNGLTSNFNKEQGQIHIGCRSKTPQNWLKYCAQIMELGLDKVTIEGYDFNINEVKDFQKFITDNY